MIRPAITSKRFAACQAVWLVLLASGALARGQSDGGAPRGGDPMSLSTIWLQRSGTVADASFALDAGQVERAIELGESALAGHLDRVDRLAALNILCIAYVSRGTPARALPHCNRLVRLSHGDWRCLNNRAIAWLGLGDVPAAIQDFELALFGLRASGRAPSVRHHGTGLMRPGLETLTGNLDLARRRYSAGLLLAKDAPITSP